MKKILLLTTTIFCFSNLIHAQAGKLDSSFGNNGIVKTDLGEATVYKNVNIQKDGKIVVASDHVLVRYNTDGSLDNTFSNDGIAELSFTGFSFKNSTAIASDGKIVVSNSRGIARYNTNGSLDTTFSNKVKENIYSVAIQSDGKILVGGSDLNSVFTIARYNANGNPDNSFGVNGKQTIKFFDHAISYPFGVASSIVILSNGKIVVGGSANYHSRDSVIIVKSFVALVKLNKDGSFDNTFGNNGKSGYDLDPADFSSMVIQNNGKIIIGGSFSNFDTQTEGVSFKRFNTDGSIDTSFNANSISENESYSQLTSIALQSNGKIVVSASNLLRSNSDGSLDSTFNIHAAQEVDFTIGSIAIANNKLYVVGGGSFGSVARYLLNDGNTSPTVTLTSPTNNTTRLAPAAHIKLSAVATDKDGTISKVEFYNGITLLHTETVFPYDYVWINVGLGNYTLTAKAYDNSGNVTTSAPVYISVVPNKAPVVSIVTPANNKSFAAPAYIHFEASASDIDGRITRVEFYNGSILLTTEYKYPYTYVWKDVHAGTYTVTAVATDNWGVHTTSAPVTVRVTTPQTTVSSSLSSKNDKTVLNDAISLRLSPNPASSIVNIYTSGLQQDKQVTLSLISVSGTVLKMMHINGQSQTLQLDVSSLVSGIYTIKVISGDKILYKQFVKL